MLIRHGGIATGGMITQRRGTMTNNTDRFTFRLPTDLTIKLQRLASIRTRQEGKRILETQLIREWVSDIIEKQFRTLSENDQTVEMQRLLRGE